MRSVELVTGEGRFSADTAGSDDAERVLMLHGFPQTRHTWREVLPAVAGAGFHAIAPERTLRADRIGRSLAVLKMESKDDRTRGRERDWRPRRCSV